MSGQKETRLDSEHIMQYNGDVLPNFTLETYIIVITNIPVINSTLK